MTLDSLADVTDLPAAWQTSADAQKALNVASAAIRDAADSAISRVVGTIAVTGSTSRILTLPRPAVAVTAVTIDAEPVTGWNLIAEGLLRTRGCRHRLLHDHRAGWVDRHGDPITINVTGTFGLADVPADIVDMCAQLAVAWLQHQQAGGGSSAGLTSVAIDDARETYSTEAAGQISPIFIPDITRNWLAARFGTGAAVVVEASL